MGFIEVIVTAFVGLLGLIIFLPIANIVIGETPVGEPGLSILKMIGLILIMIIVYKILKAFNSDSLTNPPVQDMQGYYQNPPTQ
jgi:divalent metal cation (Fe/Co/Zn/Cd) transporter